MLGAAPVTCDGFVAAVFRTAQLNPRIVFESGQFSSILSMVGAGLGVSVAPEMAIEKRSGCRFVPLADDRASRTIAAITLRGRSSTRLQDAFLTHLRAQAPTDPARRPLSP
jgi:LysR family transcriptional regulator, hydrogen peroxide-inducible genes activator